MDVQRNRPRHSRFRPASDGLENLVTPAGEGKTYYGRRNADGSCSVWVVDDHARLFAGGQVNDAAVRDLPLHLEIRNHSPTGFEWGYGGSGPAQLALALLVDALGDVDLGLRHYQTFKRKVVAGLERSWALSAEEIHRVVLGLEQAEEPSAR